MIRDPHSEEVIGLTLPMARSIRELAGMIRDVNGTGKSVLLMEPPGFGKTVLLHDVALKPTESGYWWYTQTMRLLANAR